MRGSSMSVSRSVNWSSSATSSLLSSAAKAGPDASSSAVEMAKAS